MKISIPDNVGGVSALLTTRKWEKAAIVWAYVHSSENQAHVKSDMKPYTPESFAALGIAGLRSKNTVQSYWAAWQNAINNGNAQPVKPGDTINEPATPWPGTDTDSRSGTDERHVSKAVARERVKAAIKADPSIVYEAAREDEQVRSQGNAANIDHWEDKRSQRQPHITCDISPQSELDAALGGAVEAFDAAIDEAERRDALRLLHDIAQVFDQKAKEWRDTFGYTGVDDEVAEIKQINAILRSANMLISGFAVETPSHHD